MNRLRYDDCATAFALHQSTAPVGYILDPIRYYNVNECRYKLGLVGGNQVSHMTDSLVDLESDLRGQTRPLTHCWQYKYHPRDDGLSVSKEYIKPVEHPILNTTAVRHLPEC